MTIPPAAHIPSPSLLPVKRTGSGARTVKYSPSLETASSALARPVESTTFLAAATIVFSRMGMAKPTGVGVASVKSCRSLVD